VVAMLGFATFSCKPSGGLADHDAQRNAAASVSPPPSANLIADQAADVIGKCGKPQRDFVKIEGGQKMRHVVYKKANLELIYLLDADGKPSQLVGLFPANDDPMAHFFEPDEANRRLPCARGTLQIPLE
jgi:hypothetical protein